MSAQAAVRAGRTIQVWRVLSRAEAGEQQRDAGRCDAVRVDPRAEILTAARIRAAALAAGDASRLEELLHVDFRWTSHTGESFNRSSYINLNAAGRTSWREQELGDPEVIVSGDAAVLRTVVIDTINRNDGTETYRMPMTQFWVRTHLGWQCLAGNAGPRLHP